MKSNFQFLLISLIFNQIVLNCGEKNDLVKNNNSSNLKVFTKNVSIDQFPWTLVLGLNHTKNRTNQICSAIILSDHFALTSAFCGVRSIVVF